MSLLPIEFLSRAPSKLLIGAVGQITRSSVHLATPSACREATKLARGLLWGATAHLFDVGRAPVAEGIDANIRIVGVSDCASAGDASATRVGDRQQDTASE